ncbi:unnamed protein product [Bursaphelenchus okinawaensis]|uniref:Protein aurora borealis n=1 Tax=Bursaphelenchus okinawaensis TaxID=465554 RepID=A0A811KUR7_9BILA|nr:unnamed protein product [Bursaphelenchus okinawaensis]CAG9112262.1 unnamed protein product [Bursaphelenchus okinawaensis]
MSTPSRTTKNPFDSGKFNRLIFSPGVFKGKKGEVEKSPLAESPENFQWTIEERSFMAPAFLEYPQAVEEYHEEKDERVQIYVNNYFKNEHYVPSPDVGVSSKVSITRSSTFSSEKRVVTFKDKKEFKDSSTQTDFHIPLDLDFESILKEHIAGESFLSAENSFTSKRRRRMCSSFADSPSTSPDAESSYQNPGISSFTFDPSMSEIRLDNTKDDSVELFCGGSLNSNSEEMEGPLGEVSEGVSVVRERLDLSPIR